MAEIAAFSAKHRMSLLMRIQMICLPQQELKSLLLMKLLIMVCIACCGGMNQVLGLKQRLTILLKQLVYKFLASRRLVGQKFYLMGKRFGAGILLQFGRNWADMVGLLKFQ